MIASRLSQVIRQSSALQKVSIRSFSSECAPAQKLKEVFEDYRKTHFTRETPTRFKKELVKSIECEGLVEKDSLNHFMINIGRKDRMLSEEEFQVLCKEAGDGKCLSTSSMMKLF